MSNSKLMLSALLCLVLTTACNNYHVFGQSPGLYLGGGITPVSPGDGSGGSAATDDMGRNQVSGAATVQGNLVTFSIDAPDAEVGGHTATFTYALTSALPTLFETPLELRNYLIEHPEAAQSAVGTLAGHTMILPFAAGQFLGFLTVPGNTQNYFTNVFIFDVGGSSGGGIGEIPGPGGPDVEVILRELDGLSGNTPVSISQIFKKNDYQVGQVKVVLVETGAEIPAQVDVLRRHTDGSIRHAMISFILPVEAGHTYTARFLRQAPGVTPSPFALAYDPAALDVRMDLTGSASVATHGALRELTTTPQSCAITSTVAGDRANWRFNGPIMKECVYWGRMRKNDGSVHPDLDFSIRLRTYSGHNGARFQYVVENTHSRLTYNGTAMLPTNQTFAGASLRVGASSPSTLWQFTPVPTSPLRIFVGTRFMREGTWGAQLIDLEKQWHIEDLVKARLIDMMNFRANPVDQYNTPITYNYVNTAYRQGRPLWPDPNGAQTYVRQYMWDVGDRDDIGTLPTWAKVAFVTMNRDALTMNKGLEAAELSHNFEIHYRRSMNSDTAPTNHIPGGGVGLTCGPLDNPQSGSSQWVHYVPFASEPHNPDTGAPGTPDTSHQPRVGLATYALTGDLFYLEEMQFWFWYNNAGTYPFNCNVGGPARAVAWSGMRSSSDVEYLTPENDSSFATIEATYEKILDYYGTQSYQQPAGVFPKVMPMFNSSYGLWGSSIETWVNATRGLPWQYSWVGWASELMALRGYGNPKANQIRDWVLQFPIDLYTVENDASQAWVDPAGNTWRYPAWDSQAYYVAYQYFPQMHSCFPGYPAPESEANANDFIVGPITNFTNYGHLYYWSVTNKHQENYAAGSWQPNWCPADHQQWNPDNGLNTEPLSQYNWHGYGGNPVAAAGAEAVLDTNPATRSTALPKALQALAINQQLWHPNGFNLIPVDRN